MQYPGGGIYCALGFQPAVPFLKTKTFQPIEIQTGLALSAFGCGIGVALRRFVQAGLGAKNASTSVMVWVMR